MSGTELAAVLTAVFGAFGTILFGFYKYAQAREKDFENSRVAQTKAFNKALESLGKKIEADSKVGMELVLETRKGNKEAAERNGHLGEQNENITNLIIAHSKEATSIAEKTADSIIAALNKNVHVQNVEEQHVKKSIIEDETVEVLKKKGE